ncbi:MAG: 2-hydroxyacid dehydrogenase [Maribacter sp.]
MPDTHRVALFSAHKFEVPYLKKANDTRFELVFIEENLTLENLKSAGKLSAISVFSSDVVDKEIVDYMKKNGISFVTTRSAGFNHIDVKLASKKGIKVSNVPEYSPQAIAEHALGLMLALLRKLIPSYERIRGYNFSLNGLVGSEITGKTIGIVGTGTIGKALVKLLSGFDVRVLVYDIEEDNNFKKKYDVTYVALDQVLSECDIISVHLPLTDETEYIIDKKALSKIRPSAILINAGRGKLVDTKAVVEALKEEKLGGFGMDVYEREDHFFYEDHSNEVFKDDVFARLLTFKNVIVTAHQAFLTETALTQIAEVTFKNIHAFLMDGNQENKVEG